MILSALATSVGVNLALTVLLAGVYTLLRRRQAYVEVYSPRRPYAPPETWLRAAWRRSEEDIQAAAGLDGVIFVRIFVFRWGHPPSPLLRLSVGFVSRLNASKLCFKECSPGVCAASGSSRLPRCSGSGCSRR
jgi:hypothetical protein